MASRIKLGSKSLAKSLSLGLMVVVLAVSVVAVTEVGNYDIRGRAASSGPYASITPIPTPNPVCYDPNSSDTIYPLCASVGVTSNGPTCSQLCFNNHSLSCKSVGTDASGSNGYFMANGGSACYTVAGGCATHMDDMGYYCLDNSNNLKRTMFTYCNCVVPTPTPTPTAKPTPTKTPTPTPVPLYWTYPNNGIDSGVAPTTGVTCANICSEQGYSCHHIFLTGMNDNLYVSGAKNTVTCVTNYGTCSTPIKNTGTSCGGKSVMFTNCYCTP